VTMGDRVEQKKRDNIGLSDMSRDSARVGCNELLLCIVAMGLFERRF
jgi:hypothetical protein